MAKNIKKSGIYIQVDNRDLRIFKDMDNNINILSSTQNDGFEIMKGHKEMYVKIISFSNFKQMVKTGIISKIFYLESHGIYKGRKVGLSGGGKSKTIRISTDHEGIAEELGMKMIEQAYYSKIVNVSEIEIIEEERVLTIDDL